MGDDLKKAEAAAAAAALIRPGATEYHDLKAWPKSEPKPGAEALKAEVLRRDPDAKPKYWSNPACVAWLAAHAPKPGGGLRPPMPAGAAAGGTPARADADVGTLNVLLLTPRDFRA